MNGRRFLMPSAATGVAKACSDAVRMGVAAVRQRLWAVAGQSERSLLLGTVLLALLVAGAVSYVLAQYYSIDALSSVYAEPEDCIANWGVGIGHHCFSDYPIIGSLTERPNPWDPVWYPLGGPAYRPLRNEYPAAGMVPQLAFWSIGKWFGAPQLGLLIALLVLAAAVISSAVWAARTARGVERVVVFIVCGAAAVPAWQAVDRANTVGLLAPIALGFLVALCRGRWRVVAIMVILGALIKPQFVVLVVVLFAARQWRLGAAAVGGVAITSSAAYLFWPRDFPGTIAQSIHNVVDYTSWGAIWNWHNVSFADGLIFAGRFAAAFMGAYGRADDFLNRAGLQVGYVILVVVVVAILALGRRIDPVMAGIALLATAALFPPLSYAYYLVFALPVAALVVRDPVGAPGTGIFDRLTAVGDRRRIVGLCVTLSAAMSIAQIPLPYAPIVLPTLSGGTMTLVASTALFTPLAWLITCAAIIVSYARRPVLLVETASGG